VPLRDPRSKSCNSRLAAALAAIALAASALTAAEQDEPFEKPRALRVCDDPNNLPFSNDKGEGFENKIAEILAHRLDLPLEVFHYPQRMNIVRNTLRYKLPNESDYRCDLLTGMPSGFDAVAATRPYYRSTYTLVYAKGRKIDVDSLEQFLALDKSVLASLKIGVFERTPAVDWLRKHELLNDAVPYRLLNADPNYYPGKIIEDDLAKGKLDAVVLWGPIGGYYAARIESPKLAVLPLKSEPGVRLDYGVSMGVRHGEKAWLAMIQQALDESQEDIAEILMEYNIPILPGKDAATR
jgi:mxaJ protein